MRIKLYFLFVVSSTFMINAQNVNIPDQAFKACLLADPLINLNKDGEIQVSEAEDFTGRIRCVRNDIKSVKGIEAFKKVSVLNIGNNQLTELDISKNVLLTEVWVDGNQLSNLDTSKNTLLRSVYASGNLFTSLDLSKNINLVWLHCIGGMLESLDVSNNPNLRNVHINDNKLITLNIKNDNNAIITRNGFDVFNNSNLTCIEVDDVNYSNLNWVNKDATAYYSKDCKLATSENKLTEVLVYPNPTKNKLHFSKKSDIALYDVVGRKIASYSQIDVLDISTQTAGVYFVVIKSTDGKFIQKTKIIRE